MPPATRFAPSPTGLLHLGHAHSALTGWREARGAGGRFLLRIEDIDAGRCRPEFATALVADLAWLGLDWDGPIRRQSDHMADYRAALDQLEALGVLYPCFCTRKTIAAEVARALDAPHGPDGAHYPGICRGLSDKARQSRMAEGHRFALRLDVARAAALTGPLYWFDRRQGRQEALPGLLGDVVLARKEMMTSYHLSVTVDDHRQGVTRVTRGADLFHASHLHRLLQALLGYEVPEWDHHPLLTNEAGARLSKRDGAETLQHLRAAGRSPAEVRAMAGFPDHRPGFLPLPPHDG